MADGGPPGEGEEMTELAVPMDAGAPVLQGAPEPAISGTFAIYEDGKGGYVLVTDSAQLGGVTHKHLPRALIKMMSGAAGRLGGLGALFGG